jgi:hypothetical protein
VLITARLEEATVKQLLEEILPARIVFDGDDGGRWIQIERARHIDLVAGAGLRVETGGQLQWQAAGLPIGVTFTSAQLMLRPEIVPDDRGGKLVFRPELEALDLKNVPSILDSGVLAIVNGQLASQSHALAWHFGQTLTHAVPLPPTIVPLETLHLASHDAKVEVLNDAVVFSVEIAVSFTRAEISPLDAK